ncbi:YIEGIA family protein [Paenibacillus alkaliterrae]|uniref:YIEGIA domain-containing protein n=1 Tax=Paenibacillus alkaliterrae TaxID=320909 RepID=UPI001F28140F|nr:YIEGIA domain-containing protein [Paenibacillus alkaliterrae]MCF2941665.1 YIEGIA family protein [Paenibacillus alkaliterrae]
MEGNDMISAQYLVMIVTATLAGTLARATTIKLDYRQYPSHPNGYLIHFLTGALAAALGAFIVPTLMTKNFVAVTFLSLGIQQFREVRKTERESLRDLEGTEYTLRGDSYIDGIAKTFEARNYFALLVAFAVSVTMQLLQLSDWIEITAGIIVGLLFFVFLRRFTSGKHVKDIATITQGNIEIKGSELYVDGMLVSNAAGEAEAKQFFAEEGIAAVVHPREPHLRIVLEHFGQRQAMLFEVTRAIGKKRYCYQNLMEGKVIIVLVPIVHNFELLRETLLNTPLLETVKKTHRLLNTNITGERSK